jgi:hypothetical protein
MLSHIARKGLCVRSDLSLALHTQLDDDEDDDAALLLLLSSSFAILDL